MQRKYLHFHSFIYILIYVNLIRKSFCDVTVEMKLVKMFVVIFLATSHSSHLTLKKNLCWNGKKFLLVSQINHFMSFLSQMCACIIKIFIVWITSKIKYSKSCSNLLSFSLLPHSQSLIHLLSLLTVHKHINVVTSNTARKYFLINPGGNFKERDTNCSTTRTRFKCVRHKKRSFLWILKN